MSVLCVLLNSSHAVSRLPFSCCLTPSHAVSRLLMLSHAFACCLTPSHAFARLRLLLTRLLTLLTPSHAFTRLLHPPPPPSHTPLDIHPRYRFAFSSELLWSHVQPLAPPDSLRLGDHAGEEAAAESSFDSSEQMAWRLSSMLSSPNQRPRNGSLPSHRPAHAHGPIAPHPRGKAVAAYAAHPGYPSTHPAGWTSAVRGALARAWGRWRRREARGSDLNATVGVMGAARGGAGGSSQGAGGSSLGKGSSLQGEGKDSSHGSSHVAARAKLWDYNGILTYMPLLERTRARIRHRRAATRAQLKAKGATRAELAAALAKLPTVPVPRRKIEWRGGESPSAPAHTDSAPVCS